jgi:hypothetical protein
MALASLVTRCPTCQVALPQPLLSLRGVLPVSDICPAVASHPATSNPERETPLITPPDITVQRCSSRPVVWGPKWG